MEHLYQEFVRLRTYARFVNGQRESWKCTVSRYRDFFVKRTPQTLMGDFLSAIEAVQKFEVMPSMRALWSAGPALERENLAGFNCTYLPVEGVHSFAEALYVLMNGAGVGFSVEQKYIVRFPTIPASFTASTSSVIVEDSKEGWAQAVIDVFTQLYNGVIPSIDVSQVRPYGAVLKTFGGRASGPEPLVQLFDFIITVFQKRRGAKLTTLDAHDIMCMVADAVVSGGVRRSSCISLSDLDDTDIDMCKENLGATTYHRCLANNSLVYTEHPDESQIRRDMNRILSSPSGERGLFNRAAANAQILQSRRQAGYDWGCNPCSEIILRPYQCCNLSEVVLRRDDTEDEILQKVKHATILGILQSTLDNYRIVNEKWTINAKDERLLGVSLTGLRDCLLLRKTSARSANFLQQMKEHAIQTATEWADELGINMPAAITCCKPSGTVSQLVNSASGLHPRFSEYYVRRIRIDAKDPLFLMAKDQGVSWFPEVGQSIEAFRTAVLEFPIKAPENAILTQHVTALEQLEYYKMLQLNWCEHKPSCTIYVGQEEREDVTQWVVDNIAVVSGISFFPRDNTYYELAPYESISKDMYERMVCLQPDIDFTKLTDYESDDVTTGAQESACAGNACEL